MKAHSSDPLGEQLFLDLLASGAPAKMSAGGVSMFPSILPDALVEIEPPEGGYQVGDVLLFRLQGALTLHRLIFIRADQRLVMKGDWRLSPDPPVAPDQVLGRLCFVERGWPTHPRSRKGRAAGLLLALISRTVSACSSRFIG